MGEYLTPDEARTIELPKNPFARSKRIRELAEPLGGLSMNTQVLGVFDVPTRNRLVRQAWEVEYDMGVRAFAEEYGVVEHLAAVGYGLCRLDDLLQAHRTNQ
jgi:predicted PhzF superfamily epimerase YddE/YHI9